MSKDFGGNIQVADEFPSAISQNLNPSTAMKVYVKNSQKMPLLTFYLKLVS